MMARARIVLGRFVLRLFARRMRDAHEPIVLPTMRGGEA